MLEINNLAITLGKKVILTHTNLTFEKTRIVGLVAPNGTGKTTFLKTISGLIKHEAGCVKINGISYNNSRSSYLNQLFFLENSEFLYSNISVIDHLKYIKKMWCSSVDINEVILYLNMQSYVKFPIKKLSFGMKQHVLIAMYTVSDAPVLLFDEPMNGLDPTSLDVVSKLLEKLKKDKNKLIILSSHNLQNVTDICDDIIFMKNNNIEFVSSESSHKLKKIYDEYYLNSGEVLE